MDFTCCSIKRLVAVLAVALVTAVIAWPPAGHTAFPGANGKIAFLRDGDIWVMNADRTGLTQLTTSQTDQDATWSPDGTKIAFTRQSRIYVMNADGNGLKRLLPTDNFRGGEFQPAWSPDGARIVFTAEGNPFAQGRGRNQIWVVNADGTGQPTQLTFDDLGSDEPAWSPDGTKIAFVSARDFSSRDIYVMNADGSDPRRLTDDTGRDSLPNWSPDGTRITFAVTDSGGRPGGVYFMNADGTGQIRLTDGRFPAWSPDGTKIVFDDAFILWVMNPDGTGKTQLLEASGLPISGIWPDWQPVRVAPPIARDDAYSVVEDSVLAESAPGVLGNDVYAGGSPLTAVLVGAPTTGTVDLNSDGSFTYVPAADFNGQDQFTYRVTDGRLESALAVVTLTVNPINDPPVAVADGPFSGVIGVPVTMDSSRSDDVETPRVLTRRWNFGDGTSPLTTTESVVTHTYTTSGVFPVTLVVNDGQTDSARFETTATIGTGGGGQPDEVDNFLAFADPTTLRTDLQAGTTSYTVTIVYGGTIRPETFKSSLNGQPIVAFHPIPGTSERVIIPLDPRQRINRLTLEVDGLRSDGKVSTDIDTRLFVLP